jgi:putative addiction module component (TIGR02574 family)
MTEERKRPMSVHEVVAAALELSEEDRYALVEQVQDSLYDDDAIDPTVLAEARRRLEDMKSGRVSPVPFEQLLHDLDRLAL